MRRALLAAVVVVPLTGAVVVASALMVTVRFFTWVNDALVVE